MADQLTSSFASELPKLHPDENMPSQTAIDLRRQGFDVTLSDEVGLLQASDAAQLAYTAVTHRTIVTFDVGDFPRLHAEYLMAGLEHWGIIISTRIPHYEVTQRLQRLLAQLTNEDLKNQLLWLNDFK